MGEIAGRLGKSTPEDEQPVVLPEQFRASTGIAPNEDIARWLRRHYPSGVSIVATSSAEGYFGVTVSAFSYVSLDPLLVFVALGNDSQTGDRMRDSEAFSVSMLTERHRFLADRFAGRAPLVDRYFEDVSHTTAVTGSPILADSIAWLDCRVEHILSGGDHTIYIGRAVAVGHGSGDELDPLLYFDSQYRKLV